MTTELRLQRTLAADPDRVWRALTDPASLSGWFWPERFGTVAEVDLRVGGVFRLEAPKADLGVSGTYTVVDPSRRLAMTWRWAGEEYESLVTIDLAAAAGGATQLTVHHERLEDRASVEQHTQGWSDCLDRLPGWLAAHGG